MRKNILEKIRRRKGQITFTDLLFSMMIFMGVVILISSFWSNTLTRIEDFDKLYDAQLKAYTASEILINGPGYPQGWGAGDVLSPGIVEEQGVISREKMYELAMMTNEQIADLLGAAEYHVYFLLTNKTVVFASNVFFFEIGAPPPPNASIASTITSFVLYDGCPMRLYLTLWKG